MDLLIKNGTIVTSSDSYKADIGIANGKIDIIASSLSISDFDEVIDAQDKYVMPGFIDPHVHFNLPMRGTYSTDDFNSGTRASAAGGVTTIIDFATQMNEELLSTAIVDRKKEADSEVFVDYGLHGGITNWDVVKNEFSEVIQNGVSSFKMFMAYKERGLFSSDDNIIEALQAAKQNRGLILVHAESADILDNLIEKYHTPEMMKKHGIWAHVLSRPNIVEAEAIQRAITLSDYTGGHLYVVHMSTGEGAELVHKTRSKGSNVIGETCPQYLLLTEEVFRKKNGHYYATAPQVKKQKDQDKLWQAVLSGSIQVIGTDTCTFNSKQKETWEGDFTRIPLGLPGSELMAPLVYSEGVKKRGMSLNRFVQVVSANAARIYGLYPKKGTIAVGSDADITIFDPNKQMIVDYKDMESNCDWNPYQGMKLTGVPAVTILRGKIIAQEGKCIGEKGFGQYLKRKASGNFGF